VGDEELGARLGVVPAPEEVPSASKTQMLSRLLTNLKMVYLKTDEPLKALEMVERLVLLNPEDPAEVRDRGILFARLDCYKEAIRDLESYLERGPAPADVATVREAIASLEAKLSDVQ
jgi:regulator of sirC expression with transglutaminase-like and TPR domain